MLTYLLPSRISAMAIVMRLRKNIITKKRMRNTTASIMSMTNHVSYLAKMLCAYPFKFVVCIKLTGFAL